MDTYLILAAVGFSMALSWVLGYIKGRHDIERQLRSIGALVNLPRQFFKGASEHGPYRR